MDLQSYLTEVFFTLTEVFPCFFLSCKADARVKLPKTGHGPHSSTLVVICVVLLLFLLFYVSFVCKCVLPPGDNPVAVNIYIISSI
jgi:LPXTG-motif cell wall-anchored protein